MDRIALEQPLLDEAPRRELERDPGARDRSGTRASVRLQHVAIDPHAALAEGPQIGDRAQAAADQPLDLVRAAADSSARGLALHACVRGAREHAVLRGDPPPSRIFEECGNALLDGCRTHDPRLPHLDQSRALGMATEARDDFDAAKLARTATIGPLYRFFHSFFSMTHRVLVHIKPDVLFF